MRSFYVRATVEVLVHVSDERYQAALFEVPPNTREDDVEQVMGEIVASEALREWAHVNDAEVYDEPVTITATYAEGVRLAIG